MDDPEILIIFDERKTYVLMYDKKEETRPPAKPVRFEGIEPAERIDPATVGNFYLGSCIVIGAILLYLSTLQ